MTGSLILVDKAPVRRAVDNRCCLFESFGSSFLVTSTDGLNHVFKAGAHHAATGRIVLTMLFGLTRAFVGLC